MIISTSMSRAILPRSFTGISSILVSDRSGSAGRFTAILLATTFFTLTGGAGATWAGGSGGNGAQAGAPSTAGSGGTGSSGLDDNAGGSSGGTSPGGAGVSGGAPG